MFAGFGTTMSLIVAIGAQNAFVLRQGIRRESVLAVIAVCVTSDAVLIMLGVGGAGILTTRFPQALTVMAIGGGVFLLGYGFLAARRALRPSTLEAATSGDRPVLTCLALTWLNPHVYVDIALLGTIAAAYRGETWAFGAGAVLASLCWFLALGFGARLLSGFFARASSWRVLDGLVAATMVTIGSMLIINA